jgi:hypothetical protein
MKTNMKYLNIFIFSLLTLTLSAQSASIKGQLQNADGAAIEFANVALYSSIDSSLQKVEISDEAGLFKIQSINQGEYFLTATYVGLSEVNKSISLKASEQLDLGVLSFNQLSVELAEATVTASRVMVEIKPDRTVFNVEGTINSTGSDAISLLRKAPGVTVDNNDNINVLGRAGVLLYVDGKRLPLSGEDLTGYLQSLPAEQIDRIDIITNPGAKYEAEGNAGIIDIRLKRDKSLGTNGQVSSTISRGRYTSGNINLSGNYRNKKMNIFANGGFGDGGSFTDLFFYSRQNGIILDEELGFIRDYQNFNYRVGVDLFATDKSVFGILIGGRKVDADNLSTDFIKISDQNSPTSIDSILVAENNAMYQRGQSTVNVNYRFDNRKGNTLNIDLDYGKYSNDTYRFQPNKYYDANQENILTEVISEFDTPTDIDIYTAKIDYEQDLFGGKLGLGSKISMVKSDNTFLVFDVENGSSTQDNTLSNIFDYDENVYAGYLTFQEK